MYKHKITYLHDSILEKNISAKTLYKLSHYMYLVGEYSRTQTLISSFGEI